MPFVSRALSASLVANAKNQRLRDKLHQFSPSTEGAAEKMPRFRLEFMSVREKSLVVHGRSLLGSHM